MSFEIHKIISRNIDLFSYCFMYLTLQRIRTKKSNFRVCVWDIKVARNMTF